MTTNKSAITDPELVWRTMADCPKGSKVLLLNQAGIAQTGSWTGKDDWFVGWFPLPKIPPEIRKLVDRPYGLYTSPSNIGNLLED